MQGGLSSARLHVGAARCLDAMADVARWGRDGVTAELFGGSDEVIGSALRTRARSADVSVLVDRELLRAGEYGALRGAGVRMTPYGRGDDKVHAKALVAVRLDRSSGAHQHRAIVSSAAPLRAIREENPLDFAVEFDGPPAALLGQWLTASIAGKRRTAAALALQLRGHGIFVNDPRMGVRHLTREIEHALADPDARIATKVLSDRTAITILARAQRRAGAVEASHMTSGKSLRLARQAGLDVLRLPRATPRLHATAIDTHEGTLVSSAYLAARPLGRGKRRSRELGIRITDPDLRQQVLEAVGRLEGSRMGGAPRTGG